MSSDKFQFRKCLQHLGHPVRIGVIKPEISGMYQDRKPFFHGHFIDPEGPGIVRMKLLKVRMQLDALQSQFTEMI